MKITRLSKIFDFIFGTTFIFLTCFIWTRLFLHNTALILIFSFVLTFCICGLYYFINKKKLEKKNLTDNELKQANNISNYFLLCTKQEILKIFSNMLLPKYQSKQKSDYLIINDIAIRPLYYSTTITDKEVLESYAKIKNTPIKKIVICCQNASASAEKIANIITEKEVIILNEFNSYKNLYKPLNFQAPKVEIKKKKRKKINDYFAVAFNKKRTKNYITISVIMLFGSLIMRYNLYYIISASFSIAFALYSHFNKRYNKQNKLV